MIFLSSAYLTELAVLAFAAFGKLADSDAFTASVARYQIVPPRFSGAAGRLVVAAELVSVLLLAIPVTRFWGAMVATGLFASFLVAMSSAWRRGLRVDCGCFSPGRADPIGPGSLTRTGLLLVLAVLALLGARQPFQPADLLAAILMGVLVMALAELVRLLAQPSGQVIPGGGPADDVVNLRGPAPGNRLEIGTSVEAVSAGADSVVFCFISPLCGNCRALLPAFSALAASRRVVLVSSVQESAVRAYLAEQMISLPLVTGPDVFDANGIPWPPYAVITTGLGIVLAQGSLGKPEHLDTLVERAEALGR